MSKLVFIFTTLYKLGNILLVLKNATFSFLEINLLYLIEKKQDIYFSFFQYFKKFLKS
jgi:hypothetical protein